MMLPKRLIFGLISLHLMIGCTGFNEMCKASVGRRWACPPPWIEWGGKCYTSIMEHLSWSEAKDECTKIGSVLVAPRSQEETDFLMQLLPPEFWINCNDIVEEGTWKCQDGTDEVGFRNWDPVNSEPNNARGNENCAVTTSAVGEWNDMPCDWQRAAICKAATSLRQDCTF
ncbi:lactose-binding lectin l-2-like [Patiria miniata]|uniref:C-type lectin domain-containing protein n=1 Tax=Patiria miniata TaxID=46514 RepID=A0A914A4W5_PATMI|nr:lactose-binding lectin l-2-like [Patiria miniata]